MEVGNKGSWWLRDGIREASRNEAGGGDGHGHVVIAGTP
jgi:hypothetical protein